VKCSGIPPFAKNAKDGAPDPLWQGEKYGFRLCRNWAALTRALAPEVRRFKVLDDLQTSLGARALE
jgi:hypothetical protein